MKYRLLEKLILMLLLIQTAHSKNACLSRLSEKLDDQSISLYLKASTKLEPVINETLAFSKFSGPDKGGSGSTPHWTLMGMSYEAGTNRLAKWKPFTWQGKNGQRYDFDPVQAIYSCWTSRNGPENTKEFTMLSSALNLVDGGHLRWMLISGLILGGGYTYVQYDDDKKLRQAREDFPFLIDLNQESVSASDGLIKDPNKLAQMRLIDIKKAPEDYLKILSKYQGVEADFRSLAASIKEELDKNKNLRQSNSPLSEVFALKKLSEKLSSLPPATQKAIELTMMIFKNPSLSKVAEVFLTDIHQYKSQGFGLNNNGTFKDSADKWQNNQAFYLSLENPMHLEALGKILKNQIDKDLAFSQAQDNYDKNPDKSAARVKRRREMGIAFYSSNFDMMKILGVYPVKNENGTWRPINDAERAAQTNELMEAFDKQAKN